ncbi:electron transfer flavoprotein subunit alpha/FixB family protein [Pseudomonas citronellolis]|uniref:electron transfer flavoprotein subunit alpha/FixB family protein n=1 Tax=Pseudomonas citronellolis TaxID=53408 RepID=UPI0008536CBC|nr:FAD-binding protein [Pseudomonas humi]
MAVLIVAEHDNRSLKPATLNTLSAAAQLGLPLDVLVAGHDCGSVAEQAALLSGVSRVRVANSPAFAAQLAENVASLVVELVREDQYSHVLAPASAAGKNLLPRVAALLDVAQVSDVLEVLAADTFVRPIYAGNALVTVQSLDSVKVVSVRSSAFPAAAQGTGHAVVESVGKSTDLGLSRFVNAQLKDAAGVDLGSARIVISGGRGMGNGANFALLEKVADKLGAAVGASRAAVDAGFVSNDMQVGQTGKIVAPELYIAVGISGAIQHLAGMKDSKVIVAINQDEEAPIFRVADYGLVADLFEAMPALEAELS